MRVPLRVRQERSVRSRQRVTRGSDKAPSSPVRSTRAEDAQLLREIDPAGDVDS